MLSTLLLCRVAGTPCLPRTPPTLLLPVSFFFFQQHFVCLLQFTIRALRPLLTSVPFLFVSEAIHKFFSVSVIFASLRSKFFGYYQEAPCSCEL